MTRREKVLSVTALLMIWFGAGYHFWYQPLAQQIQAVEQQIKTAESEGRPKELQSNADQLVNPADMNRFLDYKVTQSEQEKQIPKQRALPELLEQLVAWADETGVRLAGFRVEPENAVNADNADNKKASLRVIRVHSQIEGRYAQTIDFLVKLEQSERLIRVDQLELRLIEPVNSSQSVSLGSAFLSPEGIYNPSLQARISFSVYYRLD